MVELFLILFCLHILLRLFHGWKFVVFCLTKLIFNLFWQHILHQTSHQSPLTLSYTFLALVEVVGQLLKRLHLLQYCCSSAETPNILYSSPRSRQSSFLPFCVLRQFRPLAFHSTECAVALSARHLHCLWAAVRNWARMSIGKCQRDIFLSEDQTGTSNSFAQSFLCLSSLPQSWSNTNLFSSLYFVRSLHVCNYCTTSVR